ncbi:hypothetical protein ACH4VR_36455 [Streptomyces sp. NPDC020883]|uniref:hypothetical protein n=1 Tax=Streptomyces sp. NPDC020883 TaxID=3365099 RepID=UPI0037B87C29
MTASQSHREAQHRTTNSIVGGNTGMSVQVGTISGDVILHAPPVMSSSAPPRQLLRVPPSFVDREKASAELRRVMEEPATEHAPRVIVLSGPSGIGTTTLATRLLWQHQDRFPGGLLYLDMRGHQPDGPRDLGNALGQLIRAYRPSGPLPSQLEELAVLWRTIAADQPPLALLVDHAVSAVDVRILLPNGPQHVVFATSRHPMAVLRAEGAHHHDLGPLPASAARTYMARHLDPSRLRAEAQQADALLRLTGGVPGALVLAIAQVLQDPNRTLSSIVRALTQSQARIARHSPTLTPHGVIMTSHVDTVYAGLPPEAAHALRRLSLLPLTTLDVGVTAAVCALTHDRARAILAILLDHGLLIDAGDHDQRGAVYAFASTDIRTTAMHAAQQDTDGEETESLNRAFGWYLAAAEQADSLITPHHAVTDRTNPHAPADPVMFSDGAQAMSWLVAQAENLKLLVLEASSANQYRYCWRLGWAMGPFLLAMRPYGMWIELNLKALEAIGHCDEPLYELRLLNTLGVAYRCTNQITAALEVFEKVHNGGIRLKDPLIEAQGLHEMGVCRCELQHYTQAIPLLQEARRLRVEADYKRGVGLTNIQLGIAHLHLAQLDAAGRLLREARRILEKEDRHDAARALAHEGRRLLHAGDLADAEQHLLQAQQEFAAEGVNAQPWVARTEEWLGEVALTDSRRQDAAELFKNSLALYKAMGMPTDIERLRERLDRLT